jgi:hypothetical protein
MPKFTLIAEHDDETRTTVEFNQDYLPNVLMQMDMFLRGTGFVYDGSLSIEEWEDYSDKDEGCGSNSEPTEFATEFYPQTENVTITGIASKCFICGLTNEQLGHHACFDQRCPKRPAVYTMAGKL